MTDPRFVTDPARRRYLLAERFVPWRTVRMVKGERATWTGGVREVTRKGSGMDDPSENNTK